MIQKWLTELWKLRSPNHLLSTSCRPRRASGVIQSVSEVLRTRGAYGVSLSPQAGDD